MNKYSLAIIFLGLASAIAFTIPATSLTDWEGRIVGGTQANVGQFPHQVSLRWSDNQHFCGGWIHNTRWVVTAAHCTDDFNANVTVRVVVGAHHLLTDGTTYAADYYISHDGYDATTAQNDIAVVHTYTAMVFNTRVQPITLGSVTVGGNVAATVSGWGLTSYPGSASEYLMYLNTTTLTNADCRSIWGNAIFDSSICTLIGGTRGNCEGDSGGPLISGGTVIGAVSFGIACAEGYPDVYARVSYFRDWIIAAISATLDASRQENIKQESILVRF